MKYKELVKIIKDVSLALPDVNSFYTGDVYEINADQSVKYASVVLTNQEHQFDNNNDKFNYNFVLFFIDRLLDDESNRIDVQTAGISALKNIVTALEDYGIIIDSFRFTLFKERFNDVCSGAYANLTIQIDDIDCNEYLGIITPEKLKAIAINQNGEYNGLFNKVIVDVPAPYYRSRHLEATENHKLYVASDEGLDGYESVNVNVPTPSIEENRIVIEPANGTYTITPTDGHDAMSQVSLTVAVPNPPLTALHITENGAYEAVDSGYYGFASVSVDVPQPTYNSGELVAKENGVYQASDNGLDGYYAVIVDVPQSGGGKWVLPDGIRFNNSTMTTFDASGVDASQLTTMNYMFQRCGGLSELDLSSWNTSNVKYMRSTFSTMSLSGGAKLSFDTSNVVAMNHMFEACHLNSLDLSHWNVSNVTTFNSMFFNSNIVSLDISNWQFKDTANIESMFGGCTSLTNIITNGNTRLPDDASPRFYFDDCTNLTTDSLINLLNALPISTHNGIFRIGSTNLQKLSDAEKSIATNKGWSLN